MRKKQLLVLLAAVLAFSATIFPAQATQPVNGEHKVWVCHATSSAKNPYVLIHIDQAGWDNGHIKHLDTGDLGPFENEPARCADDGDDEPT